MLILIRFLLVAFPATAQSVIPYLIPNVNGPFAPGCNFITGEFHYHCVPLYLAYLIQLIFGMIGTICLIMIMWAGFEWSFSGLESDSQKAKSRLRNALLGLAFCVLSFLFVDTIISALFT